MKQRLCLVDDVQFLNVFVTQYIPYSTGVDLQTMLSTGALRATHASLRACSPRALPARGGVGSVTVVWGAHHYAAAHSHPSLPPPASAELSFPLTFFANGSVHTTLGLLDITVNNFQQQTVAGWAVMEKSSP